MDPNTEIAYNILTKLDRLFLGGMFKEVDRMLADMDVESLTDLELVSYLVASRPAKRNLSYRKEFYTLVEEVLRKRGRRDTESLLYGLE